MAYASYSGAHPQRHGYQPVAHQTWQPYDRTAAMVRAGISRSQQRGRLDENTFVKHKYSFDGELKIIKVVNNLLRNTVLISYPNTKLNGSAKVTVDYKSYRHNTVEQFCQPCRDTERKVYDLSITQQMSRFLLDIEDHMQISPENLKTTNEVLPLRTANFEEINDDSLYAMEIHDIVIQKNEENAIESVIDMALASNRLQRDFAVKVKDIINFNDISQLVGKWVVFNFKDAFKIKTKEELEKSYRLVNELGVSYECQEASRKICA